MDFLQCWIVVAQALFSQAVAGEPELMETGPGSSTEGAICYVAELGGGLSGQFLVGLDPALLIEPMMGESVDQKAGWAELLREVAESAVGELLVKTGIQCEIRSFKEGPMASGICKTLALKTSERVYSLWVLSRVQVTADDGRKTAGSGPEEQTSSNQGDAAPDVESVSAMERSFGRDLLLDIELEASLRFGCRELLLGELLDLGPGDVVELDRHIADPVDLIVGDKIVAQGEVVLVDGNFGLRVTEVIAPRKRLESIRCLF